jgi:hypothetical protein
MQWHARMLTLSRPPQQGYGYQPSASPQPQYNNNNNNNNYGGQYGQPTPPPQQYGYNQVCSREPGASELNSSADMHRAHRLSSTARLRHKELHDQVS